MLHIQFNFLIDRVENVQPTQEHLLHEVPTWHDDLNQHDDDYYENSNYENHDHHDNNEHLSQN